ncbi:hypothetical protein BCV69DRAFT_179804 [Microstroma glucosiphilum]|uniref:Uncharacterized protein n=1 Tax=Pseudomicrostroma glucosiphilum TaxID=1684307 RepID=A0A316U6Q7_9BASI|nr:hypothetical protein BCV69DRAFT_179804 [Pseudomicrostroma glucosiphilum]PWN20957.1 hypothetical protein BCV69DRAFT_179804 [Pseudomicrostroma glucosiphilum]
MELRLSPTASQGRQLHRHRWNASQDFLAQHRSRDEANLCHRMSEPSTVSHRHARACNEVESIVEYTMDKMKKMGEALPLLTDEEMVAAVIAGLPPRSALLVGREDGSWPLRSELLDVLQRQEARLVTAKAEFAYVDSLLIVKAIPHCLKKLAAQW